MRREKPRRTAPWRGGPAYEVGSAATPHTQSTASNGMHRPRPDGPRPIRPRSNPQPHRGPAFCTRPPQRCTRSAVHPDDGQQWRASAEPGRAHQIRPRSNPSLTADRPFAPRPPQRCTPRGWPDTQRMASSGPHRPNPDARIQSHHVRLSFRARRNAAQPDNGSQLPHIARLRVVRTRTDHDSNRRHRRPPPVRSRPPQRRTPRQHPPTAAIGPEPAAHRNHRPSQRAAAPHHPPSACSACFACSAVDPAAFPPARHPFPRPARTTPL